MFTNIQLVMEDLLSEQKKILFRLSTRELPRRKTMHLDDHSCVHCAFDVEETLFHLLFGCPFATACWNTLQLAVPITTSTQML